MNDPSEPESFKQGLADIEAGRVHDLDAAISLPAEYGPMRPARLHRFKQWLLTRTCDGCMHWGTNPATEWWKRDGKAGRAQKLCGSPMIGDGEVHEPPLDQASAVDCEDYHAFLLTGPRFGCVHWEAKASS